MELNNLSYSFKENNICAVNSVSLNFKKSHITAILGENGAGKSTLAKLCTGSLIPDTGSILLDENVISFNNVAQAVKAGFVLVGQNPTIAPDLTVWQNLIVGLNNQSEISDYKFLNSKKIISKLKILLEELGLELPLTEKAVFLDFANIYWVAIANALLKKPKVVFFDEPTAQFSLQEVNHFYTVLKNYAKTGACIIVITHKLQEVLDYADEAFVFNLGKLIKKEIITPQTNEENLLQSIFANHNLNDLNNEKIKFLNNLNIQFSPEYKKTIGLQISNLSINDGYGRIFSNLNLMALQGEITGIIGIKNQGLEILEDILAGLKKQSEGSISFNGKPLRKLSRNEWGYIPSRRLQRGIAPGKNIFTNIISRVRYLLYKNNFYSKKNANHWQRQSQFNLDKPFDEKVVALSGGMLQKLIFNRELDNPNPKLIICSEPYYGLDKKVQFELFKRLKELAKKGSTIMLLSSDADAAIDICDSIFVLYKGRINLSVRAKNEISQNELNKFDRLKILSAMLKKSTVTKEVIKNEKY